MAKNKEILRETIDDMTSLLGIKPLIDSNRKKRYKKQLDEEKLQRKEKNIEISNLLKELINKMNSQNKNLSAYTEQLQSIIHSSVYGPGNHTNKYELKRNKNDDGTVTYQFTCKDMVPPIMEISVLENEQNEIVSFNATYLSALRSGKVKVPTSYLNIENANTDISKVTTADFHDNYFTIRSFPNPPEIKWENMIETEVDAKKEQTLDEIEDTQIVNDFVEEPENIDLSEEIQPIDETVELDQQFQTNLEQLSDDELAEMQILIEQEIEKRAHLLDEQQTNGKTLS